MVSLLSIDEYSTYVRICNCSGSLLKVVLPSPNPEEHLKDGRRPSGLVGRCASVVCSNSLVGQTDEERDSLKKMVADLSASRLFKAACPLEHDLPNVAAIPTETEAFCRYLTALCELLTAQSDDVFVAPTKDKNPGGAAFVSAFICLLTYVPTLSVVQRYLRIFQLV